MKKLVLFIGLFSFIFLQCKDAPSSKSKKLDSQNAVVVSLSNPTKIDSQTPRLFSNAAILYMSWVTFKDDIDYLYYSSYTGNTWSTPVVIASGNNWFTNWADFPAIAQNNGSLLSSYLQKSDKASYSYDVKLNYKNRDSTSWKKNFLLHTDGTKTEHGFVSMIAANNQDEFFVTWLDGRNTIESDPRDHENGGHSSRGAMTLRGAMVDIQGNVINSQELDHRICDCCQTSAAMTLNGPVVVYRDRTHQEIRDISIVRWQADNTWSTPKTIHTDNWQIAGCPVNGPSVAAFEKNLAVAWFTAANEIPKVQVVFSSDNTETFGKPVHINTQETLGRVDIVALNNTEAVVCWMERDTNDVAYVQIAKITNSGEKGPTITLTKTNAGRATGFPQIELLNDNIYAAMTLLDETNTTSIKTMRVSVKDL
jgi:hypothetical protein